MIAIRGVPVFNNLLGYFIGLITFFAAHLEPGLAAIAKLACAMALGSLAGWLAQKLESGIRSLPGHIAQ